MDKILKALEDNATLTPEQLAVMFDKEQGEIKDLIRKYEADGNGLQPFHACNPYVFLDQEHPNLRSFSDLNIRRLKEK